MKKVLVIVGLVGLCFTGVRAQELGFRSGVSAGNIGAVDAIFSVGQFSKLHADLSVGAGVGADLLWDFWYKPFDISGERGFAWYMGVGPSLYAGRTYGYWNDNFNDDHIFLLGGSFEIGVDYHFKFPLALAVDYRPTIWIVEDTRFGPSGFGIMARYVFGK